MNYQYWVIRYVPNVARGEFFNIGLVCGCDGRDWAVEFDLRGIPAPGSLRSDLRELRSWISWFSGQVKGYSLRSFEDQPFSSSWIERLRERQSNSVQFSAPAPIEAESAAEAVSLLFPHLVEREGSRRPRTHLTRSGMRNELRQVFQHELNYLPGRTLFTQPRLSVGQQRGSFDIGRLPQGSAAVMTNTWGFNVSTLDYLERDIQSWNYLVSRLREDGGEVFFGSDRRSLSGNELIEVVYDPPKNEREYARRTEVFDAAQEAWAHARVQATPYDDYRRRLTDPSPARV